MDQIACVRIALGRGDNHPGPRRSSSKGIERRDAVFVAEIGDHDQDRVEGLSLRLQCRIGTSFDTGLEARGLQAGRKLGGICQVGFEKQHGERAGSLTIDSHGVHFDGRCVQAAPRVAEAVGPELETAVRMPARICRGLGGQPGTVTSTGMTFATRPQLA